MASNKKAQILAAVMCASSIFGSYTVVSAADTPATTISNNSAGNINKDTAKVVASENNESGTITATVKDSNGTETSKITLNGEKGTFTLNSKNLKITEAGAITGTGLTINGTSASNITSYNNNGTSATSQVAYNGVTDIVYNAEGKQASKSSVGTTSIADTIYANDGKTALASSTLSKSTATGGKVSLTAKKIVTDNEAPNTTISSLTLDGDSAKLYADTSRATVQVYNTTGNVAITAGTVNGVQGNVTLSGKNVNLGNNTFSLKNTTTGKDIAKIDSYGLNVNGTSTSTINSTGTGTNDSKSAKSEVNYNNGVKDTVTNGTYTTTSTVAATGITDTVKNLENNAEVSKLTLSTTNAKLEAGTGGSNNAYVLLNSNKTGNVDIKAGTVDGVQGNVTLSGKNASLTSAGLTVNGTNTINAISEVSKTDNSTGSPITTTTTNKTTSSVVGTGVTDTVIKINNGGVKDRTTSSVTATAVTDNVYDNILTDKPLATSIITKGNVKDTSDRYGSITLTANKYGDIYDDEGIATSNKQLGSTSLSLSNNVATISSTGNTYDEAGKQQSTTASMTLNGNTGNVTLSGKNASLTSTGLTLNKIATTEDGTPIKDINGNTKYTNYASLTTGGLTINGTSTSSIKSTGIKERYTKNEITSTGMTTTAQGDGVTYPGSNDNVNKTESKVAYTGVTDTVYDANGKRTSYSNVGTTSITDTVYDTDGNTTLASSSISKSGKTGKIALTTNKYDEDGTKTTSSLTLDGENVLFSGKNASLTSTGLTVNGTSSTNPDAKSTSTVAYNGVTDTVTNGTYTTTSTVSATGVTNTVKNGADIVADSKVSATYGITNTTYGKNIGDYLYSDTDRSKVLASSVISKSEDTGKIALTTNKYDDSGNKTTSSLTLDGENVLFSGKNASLSGSTFTLKDGSNNTARLTATGLTFTDASGQPIGGVSSTGAVTGTSLSIKAPIDPIKPNNDYVESKVTTSGVADTIKQGGFTRATSNVTINSIKDTIYTNDGKELSSSNISKSVSDATESGSVTLIANKITTNDDATTTTLTSKLNLTGDSATLTSGSTLGSASVKVDNATGNVAITANQKGSQGYVTLSGKNVNLGNNTFSLKNTTTGKDIAKIDSYGLTVNGTGTSSIKSTNSTTEAYVKNEITSGAMTTTARGGMYPLDADNKNKTTSQVSATGVRDTVYDDGGQIKATSSVTTSGIANTVNNSSITNTVNDVNTGKPLADSRLTTSGISNTTTDLAMTGTNEGKKMSTALYQNSNGISASATKKGEDGATIGTSTLTLAGNSASLKVNNKYGFAVDSNNNVSIAGNNVSIAGNNATLSGSTFTLKDGSNNTARLTATGLTFTDASGQPIGGVSSTGVVSGTRLDIDGTSISSIKSTNATTGAMGQSQVSYSGVTDTVTNAAGNKTTSQVSATGVTDTVYGTDGTTQVASSSVSTSGITNRTYGKTIGDYLYSDTDRTKILASSTLSKLSTIDEETGVTTESGNIRLTANKTVTNGETSTTSSSTLSLGGDSASLKVGNYGFAVDSNNNVSINGKNARLDTNGLSLNKVNSDGTTANYGTWNSSGLTVTATNTTGNKTTSQVSATGTIDQVYDVDGKTRIAYSNVTTSGITDSFTKDGVTNYVTTNANGTTFASTGNGATTIKGGSITTNSITVAGNTIDGGFFDTIGHTSGKTEGIDRYGDDNVGYTTSIETTFKVHSLGTGSVDIFGSKIESTLNGQTTVINGGSITTNSLTVGNVSFGDLVNRVDVLEDKTQNITPSNPGTGEGGSAVPPTTEGQTGMEGDLIVGDKVTANSGTIGGVTMENNTVTATTVTAKTGNFENIAVGGENGTAINKDGVTVGGTEGTSISKDGVTVGDKTSDNYTSITNNDVVVNNNGNKTSLTDVGNRVSGLESSVSSMNNRLSDVEDRIDKVGAMSAAIANLRTMGFDPEAPTEIAIGVGQYKSETGLALGVFHYPNQDFMLSASISTSGDEVMGGIGATWKLGRKSAAEKAKDEEARRLEKAEEMKKLAQDAKVKAQAERHAKLLAEREAQKTA